MVLGACFAHQVAFFVECQLFEIDQEFEATQCLYVQVLGWVDNSILRERAVFLFKQAGQVVSLGCDCLPLDSLIELILDESASLPILSHLIIRCHCPIVLHIICRALSLEHLDDAE